MSQARVQAEVFEKLFAAAFASHPKDVIGFLKSIKKKLEIPAKKTHTHATTFSLEKAVRSFSLTYRSKYRDPSRRWKIETLPEVNEMQPSHCLCNVFLDFIDLY